jgi:peptidoglycan/xylan/chitin deacetylase (PgdA/CDA1 family)
VRTPVVAVCVALSLCFAASASAATTQGGEPHTVKPEGGALDLISSSFGQRSRELEIVYRSAEPITPQLLAEVNGGQICTIFEQASLAARAVCVTRADGKWRIVSRGARVEGSVSQPRASELRLRFEPAEAKLKVGLADVYVKATAAGCSAQQAKAAKVTWSGAKIISAAVLALPCEHRLPRVGNYQARVWDVAVTGCRRSGAGQVSRGPSGKRVALTYDDGPSTYTPAFLRELRRLGVPATFFVIGQQVSANAALVRSILRSGSMVANHSWSHPDMGAGGAAASTQLREANAAVRRATGFTPCLFRPPYGSTGADLVSRANAQGMTSVLWSVDSLDWRTPGTGSIVSTVLRQASGGAIILSHDGGGPRSQTLAAMPQIVRTLKARGYKFVTLTDLLGYPERIKLVK